jgi:syntaxin 5
MHYEITFSVFVSAGSVLLQDEVNSMGGGADSQEVSINMDSVDRQRYQQQLQLIDEQDSYIQSRADTMQNIEQTIVELGGIFQQLAHMVKEQEEMVQR